jgi:hypothetical protein
VNFGFAVKSSKTHWEQIAPDNEHRATMAATSVLRQKLPFSGHEVEHWSPQLVSAFAAGHTAEAIVFLATDRASFVHAAVLPVDGGRTAV